MTTGAHLRYRDTQKMVDRSAENWALAEDSGLTGLYPAVLPDGRLWDDEHDRSFINMSSYSYLGLNRHPRVIDGAIAALRDQGQIGLGITPTRMKPRLMQAAQDELSSLWRAHCILSMSCTAATAGLLPLVSSGHITGGGPRVTVFDKRAHFCMDYVKPICAQEAEVVIAPHNDMDFLEDQCKKHSRVAYVADGAYSMGGEAAMDDLLALQDRYGLFLWLDDSHAISVYGDRGEGFVRSSIDHLNELTLITASLEKGFGCTGGVVMLPAGTSESFINGFAGPLCWSQAPSIANLGAILACADLHRSAELPALQERLRHHMQQFDGLITTPQSGSLLPLRAIKIGDRDRSVEIAKELLHAGFYVSPVYFPVTAKGTEGLRIMIRADVDDDTYRSFVGLVADLVA